MRNARRQKMKSFEPVCNTTIAGYFLFWYNLPVEAHIFKKPPVTTIAVTLRGHASKTKLIAITISTHMGLNQCFSTFLSHASSWLETLQYILHMYSKGFIKTLLQILFKCYSLQWEPCPWRRLQICLIWGTNFVSFSLKSPRFVISSRFLFAFSLSLSLESDHILIH